MTEEAFFCFRLWKIGFQRELSFSSVCRHMCADHVMAHTICKHVITWLHCQYWDVTNSYHGKQLLQYIDTRYDMAQPCALCTELLFFRSVPIWLVSFVLVQNTVLRPQFDTTIVLNATVLNKELNSLIRFEIRKYLIKE